MAAKPEFQIFTSLRYDPLLIPPTGTGFLNFPGHVERLLLAAQFFNTSTDPAHFPGKWEPTITYLTTQPDAFEKRSQVEVERYYATQEALKPLRVRISLGIDWESGYGFYCEPTPPLPLSQLLPKLPLAPPPSEPAALEEIESGSVPYAVVDTVATRQDAFTIYKTTKRQCYDEARARAQLKPGLCEVLLWDEDRYLTEGSTTNMHFWREGRWVSPTGGVNGTVRRKLVNGEAIGEMQVKVEDVAEGGEWVLLSNGVRGLWRAWLLPVGSELPRVK
ncbi:hypothetical protein BJ508DRAFT_334932 [Ascobolus immersus RN42]|uniref:D-aminoacid aminotransferase-like PLP-dependent enzyme n=1 Tax=Ascobolus immersus RN42 TaxID=1160509 RepID=A0A3N4HK70_ASCIM|nr:hypothetical protein BJ508DRAFT_334932 [Ascobolus immersus RN42]